ncbi:helicase associated domain-containing protein [Streptomyces sp. NPDC059970]|uniref:helicase associated domain-containing protein n=1 Tax=Streptomyces sp. NPDC059970 TaxID=3347019 RepID=UPI00369851AC
MVRDEDQAEVLPGFTAHGMDVGKWLAKQRKPEVWQALTDGQRERLEQLGIAPLAPEQETPTKPVGLVKSSLQLKPCIGTR